MTGHSDPFYGHEQVALNTHPHWLCAHFITHLFASPPFYFLYLHHTKLHSLVTFAAFVLLQQLKVRFPTARGSSGHHLFVSAFMLASKVICDDTYPNKSWMEREMCQYLEWELNMDLVMLREFKDMVKKDFIGQVLQLNFIHPLLLSEE
ncbi:hypothetical protein BD769DRAFT_1746070 [Suillus cothurnatus]|nr:hypothetical protein BD769DRAFT_1746070 [Suillus cothurnatus]